MSQHSSSARPVWRKSSHSGEQGECVEVARLGGAVGVRDSKDPGGPALRLAPAAFRGLVEVIRG